MREFWVAAGNGPLSSLVTTIRYALCASGISVFTRLNRMPSPVNATDVAQYIVHKAGPMPHMKLQKLVYYSQAWSLVWDDKALYRDRIEGWVNGPVVVTLFQKLKGKFKVSKVADGDPSKLNDIQRETIDAVLDFYGDKSSQWLSDLTHSEHPWIKSRRNLAPGDRGSKEITRADMSEYYTSLRSEGSS